MNFNNSQGHLLTDQVEPKRQWWLFVPLTLVLALVLLASMFIILTPVVGAEPAGAPAVSWASTTYTVTEGTNPLTVTVVLTPTSLMTVTVDVQDTAGTATPTVDYEPVSQTLTLLPEQITYTLPITIFDNSEITGNRSFMLVLSNPGQATLGEIMTTTITIMEDDEVITPTYKAFLPAVYQTVRFGNEFWSNEFGMYGTNNYVMATAVDAEDNLYIGGYFTYVGGVKTNYIAKWDGTKWSAMGAGLNYPVAKIAIGADGAVYVAEVQDYGPPYQIHRWDGQSWQPISGLINGYIYNLVVDSQSKVYVSGSFTRIGTLNIAYIAQWNGQTWSTLGSGVNGPVYEMELDAEDNLYVGGEFSQVGDVSSANIAKWDGSQWSAFTAPESDFGVRLIRRLTIDAEGNIYALSVPFIMGAQLWKWDGSQWNLLLGMSETQSGAQIEVDGNGALYIFRGDELLTKYENEQSTTIVTYEQSSSLPSGEIALDSQNNLYLGGQFIHLNGYRVDNIARWNGEELSGVGPVGQRTSGRVLATTLSPEGELYIGGSFSHAGQALVNHLAQWNGSEWEAVGGGVNGEVLALAVDQEGNLYVGGEFTEAGELTTSYLAKWDGQNWSTMGQFNSTVRAIIVDDQNNIYVGGDFTMAGGVVVNRVARWDGTTWHNFGAGVVEDFETGGVAEPIVKALVLDEEGNLYIGGRFSKVGDIETNAVAQWNGEEWLALGDTSFSSSAVVHAMVFDGEGDLVVGGNMTLITGSSTTIPTQNLARWDGEIWRAMTPGISTGEYDRVTALTTDNNGNLFVGGYFNSFINGQANTHILMWNGEKWLTLGDGVNGYSTDMFNVHEGVYALTADTNGNLYVGGRFSLAGDKDAGNFSIWRIKN